MVEATPARCRKSAGILPKPAGLLKKVLADSVTIRRMRASHQGAPDTGSTEVGSGNKLESFLPKALAEIESFRRMRARIEALPTLVLKRSEAVRSWKVFYKKPCGKRKIPYNAHPQLRRSPRGNEPTLTTRIPGGSGLFNSKTKTDVWALVEVVATTIIRHK